MTKLQDLVNQAEEKITVFYQRAIEIHQDARLRALAGQMNKIVIAGQNDGGYLFYNINGFNGYVALRFLEAGGYCEDDKYEWAEKNFQVRGGRLVIGCGDYGTREMLHLCPSLTIETIEQKLSSAIGECRWLKEDKK